VTGLPPPAAGCTSCAARDELIGQLVRAVDELRAEVADLRRRLGRNSGNSSMPPSADDLPGKVPPRRQARGTGSGRGRGKQPGAAGTSMTWAEPDEVIDHRPTGVCRCGADLAAAADLGVARSFQQLEVPLVTARRIQHDLHRARCGCGRTQVAARPGGVPDSVVSIGPNLRALAVYLVFQHVPAERCTRLIADVTGAEVSAGFVHSCLAKAAEVVADVVKLIKTLITAAHVAGFDETTLRCGPAGQKRYVLAAVTERYSLFFLGARTLESFRDFGILPAFAGVVVSDRYANYFHQGWEHIAGNQACLAHLIRDYQDAAECYPAAIWPVQAQRALRGLIRAWHAARDAGQPAIPPHIAGPLIREFRHAVLAGCSDVPRIPGPRHSTAQHPGRDLLEFCRDRQDDVLRFCYDTRVWPTNNISERAVRPVKTQQKISGRLTSDEATQDRLDIRSYIDTARKHGCNVIDVLRSAMTGAPWSPPIPAPT
jgi:hypothetical protein